MKNKMKFTLLTLSVLIVFIVLNNFSPAAKRNTENTIKILAHRGLPQTFDIENVKWDTNTAVIIHDPEHKYIENTIPSMRAAFDYGADIVEFDIRVTKDRQLAVFHDFLVDYRSEKKGKISDYTLEELQQMDIGYGYTSDNGKSFPLRSKGVGLMPSFDQVMEAFPDKKFLIHIKDGGPEIGSLLLEKFNEMDEARVKLCSVYGNDEAIAMIKKEYPWMKAFTARILKKALLQYELIGWTGYLPKSIRNIEIHIPPEYAKFLWGWPVKFVRRMNRVDSRVVLVQKKGPWTGGFDSVEDLEFIPRRYSGYIMTERVDRIGKLYK